jgi:hypothetical protein
MRELRNEDPSSLRWVFVPEAAPLLFQAGLHGPTEEFELAVVKLQVALERACDAVARPGQILICHRGTLDALVYWLRQGWNEGSFFSLTEMTKREHLARYTAVIHLETAALGAAIHYRRWPESHRIETAEEASDIDRLCNRVWRDHYSYRIIRNDQGNGWVEKARLVHTLLEHLCCASPTRNNLRGN